uniref:Uncharacterized protein n=1 Tax=Tetraodon nigroviridis TaxID=99883 RepID=H3CQ99_TETNG
STKKTPKNRKQTLKDKLPQSFFFGQTSKHLSPERCGDGRPDKRVHRAAPAAGASDPNGLSRDRGPKNLPEPEFCSFGGGDGGVFQAEVSLQHSEQGAAEGAGSLWSLRGQLGDQNILRQPPLFLTPNQQSMLLKSVKCNLRVFTSTKKDQMVFF